MKPYLCEYCGKQFASKSSFSNHTSRFHPQVKKYKRRGRREEFENEFQTDENNLSELTRAPPVLEKEESIDDVQEPQIKDSRLQLLYEEKWPYIRTHYHHSKHRSIYNWRIDSSNINLRQELMAAYHQMKWVSKVNGSYGFVLVDNSTEELRYYHSSFNEGRVLDKPMVISSRDDFELFIQTIYNDDILEKIKSERPDTKSTVFTITNFTLFVDKIRGKVGPIGNTHSLPDYIRNNKYVFGLENEDNLCFFRAIAVHRGKRSRQINRTARYLFESYLQNCRTVKGSFHGVTLDELGILEVYLKMNIYVFSMNLDSDGKEIVRIVRRSHRRYNDVMNLNLYQSHFSYITNIKKFAKLFKCERCSRFSPSAQFLLRHERGCQNKTRITYPSGAFRPKKTIFERLEEFGIDVPASMRMYEFHAVYDIEVWFDCSNLPPSSKKIIWSAKHELCSISVCSNVKGFKHPKFFLSTGDSYELVCRFMRYIHDISETAYDILLKRFEPIFEKIEKMITTHKKLERIAKIEYSMSGSDTDNIELPENAGLETKPTPTPLELLVQELDCYLKQLPCFGFRSSSFDFCILKKYIVKYLMEVQEPVSYCIKKGNKYICVSTERVKWLDVGQYLAPNTTLSQYMKAYNSHHSKEHFPYEWLTDLAKLNQTHLPCKEEFYSHLNDKCISDEDYKHCLQLWNENGCKTMKDFLKLYNNADVVGLSECLIKQKQFYASLGVDLAKDGITLPGLSQRILFKSLPDDVYFAHFSKKHSYLHDLFRKNIRGGQSIVLHRYLSYNGPGIRSFELGENAKPTKCVIGLDVSGMYLWSMSQNPMPCSTYTVRRKDNSFKCEKAYNHGMLAVEWLTWESKVHNIDIRHKFNYGERRIGQKQFLVDGWCRAEGERPETVWEFLGCYFHAHECTYSKFKSPMTKAEIAEHREQLKKRFAYFETLSIRVFYIYECEWIQQRSHSQIQEYLKIKKSDSDLYLSEKRIIQRINQGAIYGAAEVDIRVPKELEGYFADFQPIFKHAELNRENVGEHMKEYCEKNDILKTPRGTLINSYFGEKILILTPLLQWYMQHGLIISQVHQIIEFEPKLCFQSFGETVTNARRLGDQSPDQLPLGQAYKLIGNASYGKTLLDPTRHTMILFRTEDKEITKLINSNLFKDLNEIDSNLYEINMFKKSVSMNVSIQLGFAILDFAKLKLLQMIYDCLDVFIDRRDYQLVYSDTDSVYLGLSGDDIFEVVKDELREKFVQDYNLWFPRQYCDEHKTLFFETKFSGEEWHPQNCCAEIERHDKRTPGLFHIEARGKSFVGLNSKSYMLFDGDEKYSSKGISKKLNKLNPNDYLDVIYSNKSYTGVNRGFRVRGDSMYTYEQQRMGLSYFYGKRIVQSDGITCGPTHL